MHDTQTLTIGFVGIIAAVVVACFIIWFLVTSYVDKRAAEVERENEKLRGEVEATKKALAELELKMVREHPTSEQVGSMVNRVEAVVQRLIERIDEFSATFNLALVELATKKTVAAAKRGVRSIRKASR